MFYTSPPSPTPLPCPSAPHHRERRELNTDSKGGKKGQGPDNRSQIIDYCPCKYIMDVSLSHIRGAMTGAQHRHTGVRTPGLLGALGKRVTSSVMLPGDGN